MSLLPAYMEAAWRCYEEIRADDLSAIDPKLARVDPAECHPAVLPHLAEEAGVRIDGFDEAVQRKMVAGAIVSAWCSGTRRAIECALDAVADVRVFEWYEYGGRPYAFVIDMAAEGVAITAETAERLREVAESAKNVRSRIDEMLLSYRVRTEAYTRTGAMGESFGYAAMATGIEASAVGYAAARSAAAGEVTAVANMEGA